MAAELAMTEIEAKFVIRRPEQIDEALRALSANGFKISEHGTSTHVDQYFDTQDWSILGAGWACRVRHRHGEDKLTLKSLQEGDGNVFVRAEISQRMKAHGMKHRLHLASGPVKDELDNILDGTPVEELFRVTSRRTVYVLDKPEAPLVRIELDLDETRIEADKRTEKATGVLTFTELELELMSGSADDLEPVAALLHDEAGLTPAQ
jgi:inorganic triphosphatase YgiF